MNPIREQFSRLQQNKHRISSEIMALQIQIISLLESQKPRCHILREVNDILDRLNTLDDSDTLVLEEAKNIHATSEHRTGTIPEQKQPDASVERLIGMLYKQPQPGASRIHVQTMDNGEVYTLHKDDFLDPDTFDLATPTSRYSFLPSLWGRGYQIMDLRYPRSHIPPMQPTRPVQSEGILRAIYSESRMAIIEDNQRYLVAPFHKSEWLRNNHQKVPLHTKVFYERCENEVYATHVEQGRIPDVFPKRTVWYGDAKLVHPPSLFQWNHSSHANQPDFYVEPPYFELTDAKQLDTYIGKALCVESTKLYASMGESTCRNMRCVHSGLSHYNCAHVEVVHHQGTIVEDEKGYKVRSFLNEKEYAILSSPIECPPPHTTVSFSLLPVPGWTTMQFVATNIVSSNALWCRQILGSQVPESMYRDVDLESLPVRNCVVSPSLICSDRHLPLFLHPTEGTNVWKKEEETREPIFHTKPMRIFISIKDVSKGTFTFKWARAPSRILSLDETKTHYTSDTIRQHFPFYHQVVDSFGANVEEQPLLHYWVCVFIHWAKCQLGPLALCLSSSSSSQVLESISLEQKDGSKLTLYEIMRMFCEVYSLDGIVHTTVHYEQWMLVECGRFLQVIAPPYVPRNNSSVVVNVDIEEVCLTLLAFIMYSTKARAFEPPIVVKDNPEESKQDDVQRMLRNFGLWLLALPKLRPELVPDHFLEQHTKVRQFVQTCVAPSQDAWRQEYMPHFRAIYIHDSTRLFLRHNRARIPFMAHLSVSDVQRWTYELE